MIKNLFKNKTLFWLGTIHLLLFIILLGFSWFNEGKILSINSMFKPMKFALSIWIYAWTMALILSFINDVQKVKIYSIVAFICMTFEQIAITYQAFRGELSHFNTKNTFGIVLFALMGIFILTITLWTAYITYVFIKQKTHNLHPAIVFSIKIGLVFFVTFSLFGGYISSLQGHTIGAVDGGVGLWFINWSTFFGDLRVAHFFGIHSLQIIPIVAIFATKYYDNLSSSKIVKIFSIFYLSFIIFTLVQGILGLPLIK